MKRFFLLLLLSSLILKLSGQGKFSDPRDGNIYKTMRVDSLTWMVENLRYKGNEGAPSAEKELRNNSVYGELYNWKTAMNACPVGWRLPTGREFQSLVNHIEQKGVWKGKLADTISFGIQLAGMQDYEGTFSEMDESGYYWTSTEYDKDNAEYFSYTIVVNTPVVDISRKDDIGDIHGAEKASKYSVRCVIK